MDEKRQRIVIAEACGWKRSELSGKWCHPDNWAMAEGGSYEVWVGLDKLPNYLHSLDAMHEVEKGLGHNSMAYINELLKMCDRQNENMSEPSVHPEWFIVHATAAKRAEAFLKTINKWEN